MAWSSARVRVAVAIALAALGGAMLVGTGVAAAGGTPISLGVSQGVAFSVIGHSCGGIQEQAAASGFDATSGYPTGFVYVQTRCGGSGRGGGYHVTTYSAWLAVTWDFNGDAISFVKQAPPSIDTTLDVFDANGNELHNTVGAVNVDPSTCGVANTTYCTYRAYLTIADGFVPVPVVTAISQTSGPGAGGTAVTITGWGFDAVNGVSFGGVPATYTVTNDNSISATSPSSAPGTVDVTVTSPGGTSATSSADQFTFIGAPTVTHISPPSGPVSGGTSVDITGSGFTNAIVVDFGAGQPTYDFTVNSDTSITAVSPMGENPDTVSITVTTPGGTSATSSADRFDYVADPAPCSGNCVSVGDAAVLEGNSGTRTLAFPVTLSQPSTTPVSVTVSTGAPLTGTPATPGIDYKAKTATVTIPAHTISKMFTVSVIGDTTPESDETLGVTLSNPTAGYAVGRGNGTGTILDDDSVSGPLIGVGDGAIVVASSGAQTLKLPITLSDPSASPVTVTYSVTPDGAAYSATMAGGGDYGGKQNGTLAFAAGTVTKTVSIPIWPNAAPLGDISFNVTITGVSSAAITTFRPTGTGTILAG